jgi:hypothetical protein
MENIIRYVNGHQDAQLAAIAASEAGFGMLEDIQKKLCFAGNELQRMENEGGPSLNDEQATKLDSYFKASQRVEKVLFLTQHLKH